HDALPIWLSSSLANEARRSFSCFCPAIKSSIWPLGLLRRSSVAASCARPAGTAPRERVRSKREICFMTLTIETPSDKFKQESGIKAGEIFVVYTEIG